jgi:hypothetical protein
MTDKTKNTKCERLTYTVPEAGRKAGLGKGASYQAAHEGQMPTIKIGGRLLVPRARWDAILNGEDA